MTFHVKYFEVFHRRPSSHKRSSSFNTLVFYWSPRRTFQICLDCLRVNSSLSSIPSIRSITFISVVYIYLQSLKYSQDLILGYGSGTANTWVWQKEESGSPSSRIFLAVSQQNRHRRTILFPYVES